MASRFLDQAILKPVPLVLMAAGFYFAWPVGVALLVYILFAERLGWREPVGSFLSGLKSGLKGGASCCGPSMFFFAPGICKADQARPAGLMTRPGSAPEGKDEGARRGDSRG